LNNDILREQLSYKKLVGTKRPSTSSKKDGGKRLKESGKESSQKDIDNMSLSQLKELENEIDFDSEEDDFLSGDNSSTTNQLFKIEKKI